MSLRGACRFACAIGVMLAAVPVAAEPLEVTVVAGARAALAARLRQELETAGIVVHVDESEPSPDAAALFVLVPDEVDEPIEIWSIRGGERVLVASLASEGPEDTRVLRAAELTRAFASIAAARDASQAARGEPAAREEAVASEDGARKKVAPKAEKVAPTAETAAPKEEKIAPSAVSGRIAPVPFDAPPPPDRAKETAREHAAADVEVAPALGLQAQGASFQIEASVRWWPTERVGVGALVSAPAVGALVETPLGNATVRTTLIGLELVTAPVARTAAVHVVLSPGFALDWLHVSGEAPEDRRDLHGMTASSVLAAPYGRFQARIAMARPFLLSIGALGGAALPAVDITFDGEAHSTYSPFGTVSLGAVVEP